MKDGYDPLDHPRTVLATRSGDRQYIERLAGVGASLGSPRPRWGIGAKISQDRARDSWGGKTRTKSALGEAIVVFSYIRQQDSAGHRGWAEMFGWWGFSHRKWWWFRVKRHFKMLVGNKHLP